MSRLVDHAGAPLVLDTIYTVGGVVPPSHLLRPDGSPCEWSVTMLTGIVPDMSGGWIGHRKLFVSTRDEVSDGVEGLNKMWSEIKWGYFGVWVDSLNRETVLDYSTFQDQSGLARRIRDRIRTTWWPDELIGRFYVRWRGRDRFLGHFALTRKK